MARHVLSLLLGSTPPATDVPDGESIIVGGQIKLAQDGYWTSAPGGAGTFRGEYDATKSYSQNDMVTKMGTLYFSWWDQGVQSSWNPQWWTPLASAVRPRGSFVT